MKFKTFAIVVNSHLVSCTNTPLGCVVYDPDGNSSFAGLNLTDDGEFVPAPGFDEQVQNGKDAIEKLEKITIFVEHIFDISVEHIFDVGKPLMGSEFVASQIRAILRGEA